MKFFGKKIYFIHENRIFAIHEKLSHGFIVVLGFFFVSLKLIHQYTKVKKILKYKLINTDKLIK